MSIKYIHIIIYIHVIIFLQNRFFFIWYITCCIDNRREIFKTYYKLLNANFFQVKNVRYGFVTQRCLFLFQSHYIVKLNKFTTLMSVNIIDMADTLLFLWSFYHGVHLYCILLLLRNILISLMLYYLAIKIFTCYKENSTRAYSCNKILACPGYVKWYYVTWIFRKISNFIPVNSTRFTYFDEQKLKLNNS